MADGMHSRLAMGDSVFVLGAGPGSDIGEYLSEGIEICLLVEADPRTFARLEKRVSDVKHRTSILVRNVAVARENGPTSFNRFNLRRFSSLNEPSKLKDLYPGLRLIEKVDVEGVKVEDLLDEAGYNPDHHNWVVIDLPGMAFFVATELSRCGLLESIDRITVSAGVTSLFDGSETASDVLELLNKHGFAAVAADDSTDPNRPVWTLEKDSKEQENANLRIRVSDLERETAKQKEERGKLQQQIEERDARIAELTESVESAKKEREVAETRVAEQEKTLSDRTQEVAQRDARIGELSRRLQLSKEELHKAEGQIQLIQDLLIRDQEL